MEQSKLALVCGAGGFIGSHLVKRLKKEGFWIRGVDLKYPEFSKTAADDFIIGDLRDSYICKHVIDRYFDEVYHVKNAIALIEGQGYYDVHPPLGKEIIALSIKIFGGSSWGWRLMGMFAGVGVLLLLYLIPWLTNTGPRCRAPSGYHRYPLRPSGLFYPHPRRAWRH